MQNHQNKTLLIPLSLLFGLMFSLAASAKTLNIVAAENFYGEIAEQLGGPYVHVTSILNNPNQDPHLFSASPAVAKTIADADLVIYNGVDYDPWMERLLAATQKKPLIIIIANIMKRKSGDNPHLWYDPNTMPLYAKTLTTTLVQNDSQHQNYYQQQLKNFVLNYRTLTEKISALKQKYQTTPIIATEPVFNYLADTMGLKMYGTDFQLSVMNDTAPSASQTRSFEDDLRLQHVRLLIYNNQVINPVTSRMQLLAKNVGIAVVGISETQPVGKTYIQWMLDQLNDLQRALIEGSNLQQRK